MIDDNSEAPDFPCVIPYGPLGLLDMVETYTAVGMRDKRVAALSSKRLNAKAGFASLLQRAHEP
jgi:hypothetical protein